VDYGLHQALQWHDERQLVLWLGGRRHRAANQGRGRQGLCATLLDGAASGFISETNACGGRCSGVGSQAVYEPKVLEHTGIRFIEPELFDGYDPNKKMFLRQVRGSDTRLTQR
jgi:hypothetical protein